MSAGLDHAEGEFVALMHADLQDPPELIPEMVQRALDGADVVYARRIGRDESIVKRTLATAFYAMMRRLARVPYQGQAGDFRLMSRRVVDALARCPSAGGSSAAWWRGSGSTRSRSSTGGRPVAAAAAPHIPRSPGSRSKRLGVLDVPLAVGELVWDGGGKRQRRGGARDLRPDAGPGPSMRRSGSGFCSSCCPWAACSSSVSASSAATSRGCARRSSTAPCTSSTALLAPARAARSRVVPDELASGRLKRCARRRSAGRRCARTSPAGCRGGGSHPG